MMTYGKIIVTKRFNRLTEISFNERIAEASKKISNKRRFKLYLI